MFILFYFLLLFIDGWCTDDLSFQTKTVVVGDHVKLECSRRSEGHVFWMRSSSGNSLEFLGIKWSKTKVSYPPGILELKIADTNLHDTAFYICIRNKNGHISSLSLTYLIVKEAAVSEVPPSTPKCSENSLTLRCSVLQDSQKKSCPLDKSVLCFSAESNSSFFKNLTSSDDLKYYCAEPKCEEKIQNNESSSHSKANMWNSIDADAVRNILIAALAASQVLIVFLCILVKKLKTDLKRRSCDAIVQQMQTSTTDLQNQQKDEGLLVYSVAAFSRRKSSKKEMRSYDDDKEETIYSNIAVHEL
ncbi:hypothetical protein OJAV_G00103930 [Oryzias javanicus]|uniref:Immunoglobulin domain-containing protein n=1 Tax=Oryzias javanicus TaxID=123683 RepID=A0A3S2MV57_ORYJA|nr:hypothetical protein OJAV_G00103930 [Oryzias javanicus]